jgi:hypothetical protein
LVKKAGEPETYLLWSSPKTDRVFQRAVKENRILTIHQENVGTKKDYGSVGFHEEPNAQFLIFPKSVKAFVGRRIIGINYDLLGKTSRAEKPPTAASEGAAKGSAKRGAKKTKEPKAADRPPSKRAAAHEPEEKIVAFEEPVEKTASAEPTPAAVEPPPKKSSPAREKPAEREARSPVDRRLLTVVKRAMKDLDAGKTVAAYKRLEALVAEAEKRG